MAAVIARALLATGYLGLLLIASIPLFVLWRATKRRGPLLAVRALWALGIAALAIAMKAPLLIIAIAVLLLPSAPWPARIRVRGPAGRRRTRIDTTALTGIWSRLMNEALSARNQFTAAVRRAPRGAIRERLAELSDEVDVAVTHAWDRARRGAELDRAAGEIAAAARSSNRGAARWGRGWRPLLEDQRVIDARRDRDAAAQRLATAIAEERAQLQILVARLTEAACHATELSLAHTAITPTGDTPERLATDLVDRLTALREALAEASSTRAA